MSHTYLYRLAVGAEPDCFSARLHKYPVKVTALNCMPMLVDEEANQAGCTTGLFQRVPLADLDKMLKRGMFGGSPGVTSFEVYFFERSKAEGYLAKIMAEIRTMLERHQANVVSALTKLTEAEQERTALIRERNKPVKPLPKVGEDLLL